jgi:hypothetical protein
MAKITKVPNGPLIKKKGEFKGSTLKSGGKVKKAMLGAIMSMAGGKDNPIYKKTTAMRGSIGNMMGIPGKPIVKNGSKVKKGQEGVKIGNTTYTITNVKNDPKKKVYVNNPIQDTTSAPKVTASDRMNKIINVANKTVKKKKAGGMLKRADGSYSKRGLWDNIRANKGSGKKPTAAMLKQERKIKAKK